MDFLQERGKKAKTSQKSSVLSRDLDFGRTLVIASMQVSTYQTETQVWIDCGNQLPISDTGLELALHCR